MGTVSQNGQTERAPEAPVDQRVIVPEGYTKRITEQDVEEYLGVPRFQLGKNELSPKIGAVMGLAWTSTGGDVLPVEVVVVDGSERLTLTGQLGDVMKESAQAALTFIRAHNKEFGVPDEFTKHKEIHIHLPEGAIPKDGPSAGITLIMAMISAAACKPTRGDMAMTGEITLRGHVLAIGGLQEKLLAAKRAGIKVVLIPEDNRRTLAEIPDRVKEGLNIIPVSTVDQAVPLVFDLTTPADKLKRLVHEPDEKKEVAKAIKAQAKKKPQPRKPSTNGKAKKPVGKKKR
jgi:ATP-dependent Lon protease